MHFASHNGAVEICEELIKAGADINKISAHGLNVLHLAA
jgi:ankyrin repeat protein